MTADSTHFSVPDVCRTVDAVVIGRKEGERLRACLASLPPSISAVVYVDSGSTYVSVALTRAMGAEVLALDMSQPFSAARGWNGGLRCLMALYPPIRSVQFVDGDCEVVEGCLAVASQRLASHPECDVTCGRRRERIPECSVFNRICDREWDTPVGDTELQRRRLFRVNALVRSCGYREDLIAGEEPELCLRLRRQGWRVHRLDQDMTRHDAAMTRWTQWWKRSVRAGHAFAEGAWLHGASPERHWVRETGRAVFWGLVLPMCIGLLTLFLGSHAAWLLLIYPAQWIRLSFRDRSSVIDFFHWQASSRKFKAC